MTKIFDDHRYAHHKYEMRPMFGTHYHSWTVHCEQGAVNFHASINDEGAYDANVGMEFHSRKGSGPPSHVECSTIKAPCWHDGTSLYANTLWEDYGLKRLCENGNHDAILRQLETEAHNHWRKEEDNG